MMVDRISVIAYEMRSGPLTLGRKCDTRTQCNTEVLNPVEPIDAMTAAITQSGSVSRDRLQRRIVGADYSNCY